MLKKTRWVAIALTTSLLCACGGGSGGGGVGGGSNNGSLSLSTSSITFNATSPVATPAAQNVSATVNGAPSGSTLFLRIEIIGTPTFDVSSIQITGPNTGMASVVPHAPGSVGAGAHSATIRVTACTSGIACTSGVIGTPQTIAVTYNVSGIATTAPSATITVSDTSAPGANSASVTLLSAGAWTATSSMSDLSVSPASGTAFSTPLTLTLGATAADQLPTGPHQANITFTSGTSQFVLEVTINIVKPQILLAAPRVIPVGEAGTVYLRGQLLNLYPLGEIRFGAQAATSFAVDQSYLIRAGLPTPLAAGAHAVSFTNAAGTVIPRSTADIVVVDALDAPAQVLAYPDARARRVTDLHFDAENSALVLGVRYPDTGESASEVLRYVRGAGGWLTPSVRSVPYLSAMVPRIDGQGWIATAMTNGGTSNANNVILLCTPDLGTCSTALSAAATNRRWTRIAIPHENQPWVVAATYPDPVSGASELMRFSFTSSTLETLMTSSNGPVDGMILASVTGQRVVTVSSSPAGTPGPIGLPVPLLRMSMDREGSRLLLGGRHVIDVLTSTQQASLPTTTLAGVLNRAGDRAYTFDEDGKIHTFDLSVALFSGIYPEIGTGITPLGDPGAGTGGADMHMTLSPDGGTLFLAGAAQIVVQPLP